MTKANKNASSSSNVDQELVDKFHAYAAQGANLAAQAGAIDQDSSAYMTYAVLCGLFCGEVSEANIASLFSEEKEIRNEHKQALALSVLELDAKAIQDAKGEEKSRLDRKLKKLVECANIALYLVRHAATMEGEEKADKTFKQWSGRKENKEATAAQSKAAYADILSRAISTARDSLSIDQVALFAEPKGKVKRPIIEVRQAALDPNSEQALLHPKAFTIIAWESGRSFKDLKKAADAFFTPAEEKAEEEEGTPRGKYQKDKKEIVTKLKQVSTINLVIYLTDWLSSWSATKKSEANQQMKEELALLHTTLSEKLSASDHAENTDTDGLLNGFLHMAKNAPDILFSDAPYNVARLEKLSDMRNILNRQLGKFDEKPAEPAEAKPAKAS